MSRTCSVDSRNVVANVDISENISFLCRTKLCFFKGLGFFLQCGSHCQRQDTQRHGHNEDFRNAEVVRSC